MSHGSIDDDRYECQTSEVDDTVTRLYAVDEVQVECSHEDRQHGCVDQGRPHEMPEGNVDEGDDEQVGEVEELHLLTAPVFCIDAHPNVE